MDTTENYKTMDQLVRTSYAEPGKRYKIYKKGSHGGADGPLMSLSPDAKMRKQGNAICIAAYPTHYIFRYKNYCECISKQDLYAKHYVIKEYINGKW